MRISHFFLFFIEKGGHISFPLHSNQSSDGLYLIPDAEKVGLVLLDNSVLLADAVDEGFEFLQFHEVVSFVDWFVFADDFFLLFELLVVVEVDLFGYVVLAFGELLDPQIHCFLEIRVFLLESIYFLVQNFHMLVVFFMVLEGSV